MSAGGGGSGWNVAVTSASDVSFSEHKEEPEHAPDQLLNAHPWSARASSVTDVPSANCAEHLAPQSIPSGAETTRPDPWTATRTARDCPGGIVPARNVARTDASTLMATVHPSVPEHAPSQPLKVEPAADVAVKVTGPVNVAVQVLPQSIPAGADVTVPSPDTWTESACDGGGIELDPPSSPRPHARTATARTARRKRICVSSRSHKQSVRPPTEPGVPPTGPEGERRVARRGGRRPLTAAAWRFD
jgi:hypothetical protein